MPRHPRPIRPAPAPQPRLPPRGQAAATEAALEREVVRHLGAVPLLVPLIEGLGLRELINRRAHPTAASATDLDVGVVGQVLVFNRLLAPRPLVHVETWVSETVLPEVLGVQATQCNDDRLARTLDTLCPHLDDLWQDLIVAAVRRYQLDLSQVGYDITSVSFCGAYEQAELVTYGYSRDHRPDRQQLELAGDHHDHRGGRAGGLPRAGGQRRRSDHPGGELAAAAEVAGRPASAGPGGLLAGHQ